MRTVPRRRSGRALGTAIASIAVSACLLALGPTAWAQTVPTDPPPSLTESPTPAPVPTIEATLAPTLEPTVEPTPVPAPTVDATMTASIPQVEPTEGRGSMSATLSPDGSPVAEGGDGAQVAQALDDDPLRQWRNWTPTPGAYDTSRLDRRADRARRIGWTEGRIQRQIYAPFIVVGPATWSDSWGALRLIAGPRPHRGQDVLCTYGAPVLATERGTVSYSVGVLGGLAAYLHRPDGGFYYYAHLSGTPEQMTEGTTVSPGDVIGYCGASGDASVPHVHFSYVTATGESVDPMSHLRMWLAAAEDGLPHVPGKEQDDHPQRDEELVAIPTPARQALPPAPVAPMPTIAAPEPRHPLRSPATLPAGAVLLGLPLLGLLRRRTRESLF